MMMPSNPTTALTAQITQRLTERFSPSHLQLHDDSAAHAGHAGAASGGKHYHLVMVAAAFTGLPRMTRHRLVYDALSDFMHTQIHALSIQAFGAEDAPQFAAKSGIC